MDIMLSAGLVVIGIALGGGAAYSWCSRKRMALQTFESISNHLSTIPIQGFSRNGTIFVWNRGSELIYGYEPTAVYGKNIAELLLPEAERSVFFELVDKVYETQQPQGPRQWTVILRQGARQVMSSTLFPHIKDGICQGVFCVDIDITDIKNKEAELQRSHDATRTLFETLNEAVFLHEPETGTIVDINHKTAELFGYSRDEILSLKIADISFGNKEETQKRAQQLVAKAYYEGPQVFEWLCQTKANKVFPAEVNLHKTLIDGRPRVVAIVRDVSQRKRTEDSCRMAEKRYLDFVQNASDIVFSVGSDGAFTMVNAAVQNVTGFLPAEVIGQSFSEFVAASHQSLGQDFFNRAMQGEKQEHIEIVVRTKAGREASLMVSGWPEYDSDGRVCGFHGVGTNITDQKTMLERMREMVIQTVSMLSETISVADRYTEQHCERLQEFSLQIGKRLQLDDSQLENLKYAALLHDVGKVGVPIHILLKKGKLTNEEWEKIREHPKKGADIVRRLDGFEDVAEIIEQHQERFDGKGYPRGLSEEGIRREAAIISVVDAFDAMTSDRPYRKAMKIEEAVAELERNSGTQFDPAVVKAFVSVIASEQPPSQS